MSGHFNLPDLRNIKPEIKSPKLTDSIVVPDEDSDVECQETKEAKEAKEAIDKIKQELLSSSEEYRKFESYQKYFHVKRNVFFIIRSRKYERA